MALINFGAIALLVAASIASVQADKKIFCYYSSFAQHRPSIGKFMPEDVDPWMCTHLIYAFVDITPDGRDLLAFNWNDQGPDGLYQRTMAMKQKNPSLKILLAVGGWQIGSKPFIPMIHSSYNRQTWVKNVIRYLREHNFDGMDMDWEFPATRGSPPEDKHRFTLLMKELYEAFRNEAEETGNEKLILTCATASGTYYIAQSYEPYELIKYMDYMLLMTYNYHGHWEKETGHHSGLYKHPLDPPGEQSELHTEWSIDYWMQVGVPKSKLILGIPTYGMSYTLADPSQHGVRSPAKGGGRMGPYTSETGILSYYEVCEKMSKEGWKSAWIEEQGVPYAYGGDQWVGFENSESARMKAENIIEKDLAGAFVWSIEMDDFGGTCGQGRYPLLSTIAKTLRGYTGSNQVANSRTTALWHPTPASTLAPTPKVETKVELKEEDSEKKHWEQQSPWSPRRKAATAGAAPKDRKRIRVEKKQEEKVTQEQHHPQNPWTPWISSTTPLPQAESKTAWNEVQEEKEEKKEEEKQGSWEPQSPWSPRKKTTTAPKATAPKTTAPKATTPSARSTAGSKMSSKAHWNTRINNTPSPVPAPAQESHNSVAEKEQDWAPRSPWSPREGKQSKKSWTKPTTRYFNARPTGRPSVTQPPVTEPVTSGHRNYVNTRSPSAAGSADCTVLGIGMFPDPASCERFIMCIHGAWMKYGPFKMNCPAGTRYDDRLKICNHASEVKCSKVASLD